MVKFVLLNSEFKGAKWSSATGSGFRLHLPSGDADQCSWLPAGVTQELSDRADTGTSPSYGQRPGQLESLAAGPRSGCCVV